MPGQRSPSSIAQKISSSRLAVTSEEPRRIEPAGERRRVRHRVEASRRGGTTGSCRAGPSGRECGRRSPGRRHRAARRGRTGQGPPRSRAARRSAARRRAAGRRSRGRRAARRRGWRAWPLWARSRRRTCSCRRSGSCPGTGLEAGGVESIRGNGWHRPLGRVVDDGDSSFCFCSIPQQSRSQRDSGIAMAPILLLFLGSNRGGRG